jgi:hypothetical protein
MQTADSNIMQLLERALMAAPIGKTFASRIARHARHVFAGIVALTTT